MARVTVVRRITSPGGRTSIIKRVPKLSQVLSQAQTEATATQLRVMAEETRELVIDRLFAGRASRGTVARVARPKRARPSVKGVPRAAFRHAPHAPSTVERKADPDNDLDGRKLIETGHYVNNIVVWKETSARAGVYYRVGLRPRPHRGFSPGSRRITLLTLALIHERGSARHRIPARPHWGPTVPVILRVFRRQAADVSADVLRRAARAMSR